MSYVVVVGELLRDNVDSLPRFADCEELNEIVYRAYLAIASSLLFIAIVDRELHSLDFVARLLAGVLSKFDAVSVVTGAIGLVTNWIDNTPFGAYQWLTLHHTIIMVLLAYGDDRADILALPQKVLETVVDRYAAKRLSKRGLRTVQAVLSGLTAAIYVLLFSLYWYSEFPIMDPAYLLLIGLGLLRVKPAAGRNVLLLVIGGVIAGLSTFLRTYGAYLCWFRDR
jgi:hypothetical protein